MYVTIVVYNVLVLQPLDSIIDVLVAYNESSHTDSEHSNIKGSWLMTDDESESNKQFTHCKLFLMNCFVKH